MRLFPGTMLDSSGHARPFTGKGVRLYGGTSGYIGLLPPSTITSHDLTLPTAQGGAGTVLTNNGSGVLSWGTPASAGVSSITGTSNQVNASASTGAITLSLPQDIHTGAAPTFASLTLSALTLGSIPFISTSGLIAQDNAAFFWHATNKRLGINTTAPGAAIDIWGTNATTGGIELHNTSNSNRLTARLNSSSSNGGKLLLYGTDGSTVAIQLGATDHGWFNTGGNFSIGTATANERLTVNGGIGIASGFNLAFITGNNSHYAKYSSASSGDGVLINGGQTVDLGYGGTIGLRMQSGKVGIGPTTPTAVLHLKAGTATANTAPLQFTSGTYETAARAGLMEYNGQFSLTPTDATRRFVMLAAASTKTTAGAPYTNDGYVTVNINGTDIKLMTTAG